MQRRPASGSTASPGGKEMDRHESKCRDLDRTSKRMNTLLSQLSNLFLGAVPTVVLFVVVWVAYRVIVHGKLVGVLSERRERTAGALEKAHAATAASEARTAEYEQQIRDAKLTIYKAQELRRRSLLDTR